MMKDYSIPDNIEAATLELLRGPKFPDKEFVRGGATFAEVYAMAADLCRSDENPGRPRSAVCLAAEDKAVIAAALLAALAGGPPLLLPYAFSAHALAELQQMTGFTTAVAESGKDFPEGVEIRRPKAANSGTIQVLPQASPRAELLRIFTGGSTGTPQIWSKTGINMFGEGLFLASRFAVTENDCILATIPPYHIYGLLFSVILPLVSSATVIEDTPSFPNEIVEIAEKQQATILVSIPVHYRVLRERTMALRLAFSSAGMLDQEDNRLFSRQNTGGIVEVYGSTETGGIAARNRALGEEFFTPFKTIQWQIVDSRLAVRTPFISPELPVDAQGFFITGDRVETKGANQFALQGRVDSVTKVAGKRVDLEEIVALIKKEPGVADCVVMALPDPGGREHRIGGLVQGDAADLQAIKRHLTDRLEPYALPKRLIAVERIPLSANGKYDWTAIVQLLEK
jgi:acyl-coenzyme A synthetase/AMP-(fatty) acid ligase